MTSLTVTTTRDLPTSLPKPKPHGDTRSRGGPPQDWWGVRALGFLVCDLG